MQKASAQNILCKADSILFSTLFMIIPNPDVTDFSFILSIFFLVGSYVANARASTSSGA
jgi:hypothetical protein